MTAPMQTKVKELLESYQKRQREIAVLEYELNHGIRFSNADAIQSANSSFGEKTEAHRQKHISAQTHYIAIHYNERMDRASAGGLVPFAQRLHDLKQIQERLTFYVSLLDARQAEVLRLFYFQGFSQQEVAKELDVSVRTIQEIKSQAISDLAELYALVMEDT